ncbi:hypothetical protein KP509_27G025800 [Ceratopteris richardii]|uniref:Uncharacterized protein n=1 Tax=Ceratopteris richardii TaxID=49495 RepID=A0A8T2RH94_CERRI|nr:hypothetical protein KP509_27G025800 [Ceratopteris richardii]
MISRAFFLAHPSLHAPAPSSSMEEKQTPSARSCASISFHSISPLQTNQRWLRKIAAPICIPVGAPSFSRPDQPLQRDASFTPRREDSIASARSSAYAGPSRTPVASLQLAGSGQPMAQIQHLLMHSAPSDAIECPLFLTADSAIPCAGTSVSAGVSPTPAPSNWEHVSTSFWERRPSNKGTR